MGDKVKVSVLEENGSELLEPTERLLTADITDFDPSNGAAFDPADTDVELALNRLANQTFDDVTEAEGFVSNAQETTTSDGWVSKSGFPFTTTSPKTAGKFSVRWFAEVGQTKTNRNFGFRVRWRPAGGTWADLASVQLTVNRDNDVIMQSGFKEVTLPSNGDIEIDVQHGQTTQGSASILQNVSVEVRRLG